MEIDNPSGVLTSSDPNNRALIENRARPWTAPSGRTLVLPDNQVNLMSSRPTSNFMGLVKKKISPITASPVTTQTQGQR